MLTLAAVLASSIPLAACGGKSSSSNSKQSTGTTSSHKYKTKPGY
jgi:hypothetical protein